MLCKDQCSLNESNHEIKYLDLFTGAEAKRSIDQCIVIDNNIFCFQRHLSNGIIIPKFEGNYDDSALEKLSSYLIEKFVKTTVSVKSVISSDFGIETIMSQCRTSLIKQMMNKNISINSFTNPPLLNEQALVESDSNNGEAENENDNDSFTCE